MFFTERKINYFRENSVGICKECGDLVENIQENEENIYCPFCEEFEVVGINKAISCGLVEIIDEKDIMSKENI